MQTETQGPFSKDVLVSISATTIRFFLNAKNEDALFMDADYQREYVWEKEHQQLLLDSVFTGTPLEAVSLAFNSDTGSQRLEIIDGKQTLTTLLMFIGGQISYHDTRTNQHYLFSDLSTADQNQFLNVSLPYIELRSTSGRSEPSRLQKLRYFHRKNFAGVKQTAGHRQSVEQLIRMEEDKGQTECQ